MQSSFQLHVSSGRFIFSLKPCDLYSPSFPKDSDAVLAVYLFSDPRWKPKTARSDRVLSICFCVCFSKVLNPVVRSVPVDVVDRPVWLSTEVHDPSQPVCIHDGTKDSNTDIAIFVLTAS